MQLKTAHKKITITDVARLSGVSISTVSKALNLAPHECPLNSKTRSRILQVASKLNYQPNWMNNTQTQAIGLIQSQDCWMFRGVYDDMLRSILKEIQLHDYLVSIQHYLLEEEMQKNMLSSNAQVSGNILFGWSEDELIKSLQNNGLPLVLINHQSPLATSIIADDYNGARLATEHLLELGHQHIAYYSPVYNDYIERHYSHPERLRGYEDTMRKAGFADCTRVIKTLNIEKLVTMLTARSTGTTAVICYKDTDTVNLLRELHQRGVNIPEELSIITFNDITPTDVVYPPLTAVKIPSVDMGRASSKIIFDMINNKDAVSGPAVYVYPEELTIRHSTARPLQKKAAAC